MTRPRRGEIWWIEAPAIPRRPAAVLTRDEVIPVLNRILVVTATTRIRGIPTEVQLGVEDGMPRICVLTLDNLERVPLAYFRERMTTLSSFRMEAVCRAMALATGC